MFNQGEFSITNNLRFVFLGGAILFLFIIAVLLKRKKLSVQYSILWIAASFVLIIFALFPNIVSVMRDILNIETDANFIFIMLFAFVLLLLLSLSVIITGLSVKAKRLSQTQALLEERLRRLEEEKSDKKNCTDITKGD